jgi:hypothetical protein
MNASHPQALRNLDEHRGVVDEDSALRGCLGKVKGEPEDLNIWLPHSNETGRDECVHQLVELEGPNAMGIDLARLVADHYNLQTVLRPELGYQAKHLWKRLRLSKHEIAKLAARKRPLFMEHDPPQVFLEGEFALLVRLEDQTMTLIHLSPVQFEMFGRSIARKMFPSVGEQHPAYIYKQGFNWE